VLAAFTALASPAIGAAQSAEIAPATSASDSVHIGCSGGYTGLGIGNALARDGQLSAYTKPLQEAATHTPLRRDSAGAAAVFTALERIRFRAFRFSEIGNMTCYLILIDGEGKHEVDWVMGRPPQEIAPALDALRRAFGDDRRMWP
jgi:hypothetical protein